MLVRVPVLTLIQRWKFAENPVAMAAGTYVRIDGSQPEEIMLPDVTFT